MTSGVRRGDPLRIRAGDWNAVNRAARVIEALPTASGGGPIGMLATSPSIALARNIGSTDIPRWGAVVCTAPVVLPADNEAEWGRRIAIDAKVPDSDSVGAWAGVAITPIQGGKFGRVCLAGTAHALVEVADEKHTHARIAEDEELLQSSFEGQARILWKESGTGEKRALVMLGESSWARKRFALASASAISGRDYQWNYSGAEVTLDADGLPAAVSGGVEATLRNLDEVNNTATFAGGIDPTTLPAGFDVAPIGQTDAGWQGATVDAEFFDGRWWFRRLNVPVGECPGE